LINQKVNMYEGKVLIPTAEGPTHEMIDRNIYNLFKSIERFEEVLDGLEGNEMAKKEAETEKHNIAVVSIYKQTPGRISAATDRIYQLLDRLQNQFS